MKRSPLRIPQGASRLTVKLKKCKVKACRKQFVPAKPFQEWCDDDCAHVLALEKLAKVKAKQAKVERAETRAKLEKFKRKPTVLAEVQKVFNAYRREVSKIAGHDCISCGGALDWTGNQVDAGHYRSVGSAPHLRFTEANVWAQCKRCNNHLAGNHVNYRIGLIRRIGLEAVEALEADNEPRKYTIAELVEIKALYKRKLKELREAV